jgi:hypothetical protein
MSHCSEAGTAFCFIRMAAYAIAWEVCVNVKPILPRPEIMRVCAAMSGTSGLQTSITEQK